MRKTAYRLLKNAQKMAKKHDFQEQKNAPKAKNHGFFKKFQKRWIKLYLGACLPHS
jgi:hypothetical protein